MSQNDFYNDYWVRRPNQASWSKTDFDRVLGILKGRNNILDYGCGRGRKYRSYLLEASKQYSGADVSNVALDSVRRDGGIPLEINVNTSGIEVADNFFDGAVCSEVLEHLFDPLAAAKEIHRTLQAGAPLVVTVPNFGFHPWRLMAFLRARVPSEPDDAVHNPFNGVHIRYFSAWTLRELLEMAGFTEVHIDSYVRGSVWDIFRVLGPLSKLTVFAHKFLPSFMHFRWLADLYPGIFAERLRAVCVKAT